MIFEHFPYTNFHNLNDDWILNEVRKMSAELEAYVVNNQITFADPINWIITGSYAAHTITKDPATDTWYISRKPVPPGILISNGAYWEELGAFSQAEQSLICNVADYGVLGVEDADYTAELQEALNNTNYIAYYFPTGTYSFGTVYTSRPLLIFGAGETTIWKPLHRIATSNQYKTMLESTGDLEIRDIQIVGNNSVETETGQQFLQTAILRQYGHKFRMTGCTIDQIYDGYHLSVGNVAFPDREGLLLYVKDADEAEIDHCTFKTYGGEELCWISRSASRFGGAGKILLHDNLFKDRVPVAAGGTLDGGSAINVLGGDVYFYSNTGRNYYERGSLCNLLGNMVEVYDNMFTECPMSNWIDCSEGYYVKAKDVYIHDNYVDDTTGVCEYSVKAQAVRMRIVNNHLEGSCPIKTYGLADPSTFQYVTYIADASDWPRYELALIENNTLILTANGRNYVNSGISLNQSNVPVGSRSVLDKCYVIGNVLINKGVTTFFHTLYTGARIPYFFIKNNVFPFAGATAPTASYLSVVCLNETTQAGDLVILEGNHFDSSNVDTPVRIVQQLYQTIANTVGLCGYNTIKSDATVKALANAEAVGFTGEYNLGFTSVI